MLTTTAEVMQSESVRGIVGSQRNSKARREGSSSSSRREAQYHSSCRPQLLFSQTTCSHQVRPSIINTSSSSLASSSQVTQGDCFNSEEEGKEIVANVAITLASEMLGVTKAEVIEEANKAFSGRINWIRKMYQSRAINKSNEEELDKIIRGFILYLLRCVIFPDETKNKVYIYYLGALKDVKNWRLGFANTLLIVCAFFRIWNTTRWSYGCASAGPTMPRSNNGDHSTEGDD
ncbi:hypothetical protein LguiA_005005 [Lonicera macranthoides]